MYACCVHLYLYVFQGDIFIAEQPLVVQIGATLLGGTPDLVVFCDERRSSIKVVDWKAGTVTDRMRDNLETTADCKLGFIRKQLSMYAC